ncbi:MAG: hypothetical protein EHM57_02195 [Actinobacteria bacterium]|nr:MAG: hypothetical protein EHM57_02195 [Actinomycetota bacterium]
MTDPAQLPTAAMIASYRVADFDTWKAVFDSNAQNRIDAGYLGHHINRAEDDPNSLSIYFAIADVDKAKVFVTSDQVRALMAEAGVSSAPEFTWMKPVREATVNDRELPAMIIRHRVEDFDNWLARYDAAGELQQSGGIIGHAANRGLDDPSLVIVYHQAESFDTLRSFLRSDELRAAMKEAGIVSDPEVTFYRGGLDTRY